jgi:CRISPR/Cas system-associated exonuclease Cas4 (RecB family)
LTPLTVPAHSQKLQDEVKTQVVSAAKGITAEKFDPKPDEKGHCQWCDYMQVCPAFQGKK